MLREEFVKKVLSHQASKSELCRQYGISRPTGDKWIERYLNGDGLEDRCKAPFKSPNKTLPETEAFIVGYRRKHPAIGAVKLHRMLANEGVTDIPSPSTINAILKRNGCISKEASAASTPHKRFVKPNPNDMWQADFKGNFALKNNERCYPLNVIDDHSRFNLCSDALGGENLGLVSPVFERLFREYGLPFSLLCDNGNPWGTAQSTGYTRFEVWLMELGILTIHCSVRHPQTQGKDESYNRSMTKELLKFHEFSDMAEAQEFFDEYREFYNNKRPHYGLGLDVPAKHYRPSEREYPERIREWEYPPDCKVHRVKSTGFVTVNGQGYFLSEAFGGKEVAVRESSIKGCYNIYFRQFIVGRIDVDKRVFVLKRAYLIDGDPRFTEK